MAITKLLYVDASGFHAEQNGTEEVLFDTINISGAIKASGVSATVGKVQIGGAVGGVGLDLTNTRAINAANPTAATDLATKAYVDSLGAGFIVKDPVRLATTEALGGTYVAGSKALTGMPTTLDGITLKKDDRVLVKDQATGTQNGIYYVYTLGTGANGEWRRTDDFNDSTKVKAGSSIFVDEGNTQADNTWVLTTNNPIVLDTTSLKFTQYSGAGSLSVDPDTLDKTSNTLSVTGLPSGFKINKVNVSANVTAANLTALTAGSASNTTLHRHANATTSADGYMASGDKIKLDGITAGATSTPLASTPPVNVTKAAAAVGVGTTAARADHKHDITTAAAVTITALTNGEGSATSLARSDHTHAHGVQTDQTLHALASAAADGFMSKTDFSKLAGIAPGANKLDLATTPPLIVEVQTADQGTGTTAARADHKHDVAVGATADIKPIASSSSGGSSAKLALADHVHAHGNLGGGSLHALASTTVHGFMDSQDKVKLNGIATGATKLDLGTTAPPNVAASSALGGATTAAKSDHTHGHGNQAGGTLHALATSSAHGFLPSTDKAWMDSMRDGDFIETSLGGLNLHKHRRAASIVLEEESVPGLAVIAGATIAAGQCVYLDSATSRYAPAASSADDKCRVIGIVPVAATSTNPIEIVTYGPVTISSPGLVAGKVAYLTATGGLSNSIPTTSGHHIVEVGMVLTATEIFVNPRYVAKRA